MLEPYLQQWIQWEEKNEEWHPGDMTAGGKGLATHQAMMTNNVIIAEAFPASFAMPRCCGLGGFARDGVG